MPTKRANRKSGDKREQKAQSALEYIMTYSWAILIIGVLLVIIYLFVLPFFPKRNSSILYNLYNHCHIVIHLLRRRFRWQCSLLRADIAHRRGFLDLHHKLSCCNVGAGCSILGLHLLRRLGTPFHAGLLRPISSTGIGTWVPTTDYLVAMYLAGCSI